MVVVGGFAITAKPSFAQSPKGPADVHVVNAATDPVPVSMTGTHSVNVANTPNVNVTNTPNVNVSSLPAVQIGNAAANPIPVTVLTMPATQAPEVFHLSTTVTVQANESQGSFAIVYTVPTDKRLVIDFVSFMSLPQQGESFLISVAAGLPGQGALSGGWFGAEYKSTGRETCSEMADIVADPGMEVRVTPRRDQLLAFDSNPVQVRLTGRLYDVP